MECKVKVQCGNSVQDVKMDKRYSILEGLIEHKIMINHSCGGNGTCGTCLIDVIGEKELPKPNDIEIEILSDRKYDRNQRLSCQNYPVDGLELKIKKLVDK